MLKIHIKPLARNDLLGIWQYSFEKWGASKADTYLNELDSSIRQLSQSPQLGRAIDDVRQGMRLFPCKHHIVLYQIDDESLVVVRVLHERMDIHRHNIQ
jgi:toxin ParE1/3/4